MKAKKQKLCKNKGCGKSFTPSNSLQVVCGYMCGLAIARASREAAESAAEKVERAEQRVRRESVKTKGQHMKEVQAAFNAIIRERDKDLPCISCGRHHQGQYHAGHYRSVGSTPELRFEPLNVHKQCAPCNNHKSGNVVEYRINLVKRIGVDKVEWLEGPHEPKRYTIEDLVRMKAEFRAQLRAMQKACTTTTN